MTGDDIIEMRLLRLRVAHLERRLARLEKRGTPRPKTPRKAKRRWTVDAKAFLAAAGK